jgi:hypothetical protein
VKKPNLLEWFEAKEIVVAAASLADVVTAPESDSDEVDVAKTATVVLAIVVVSATVVAVVIAPIKQTSQLRQSGIHVTCEAMV